MHGVLSKLELQFCSFDLYSLPCMVRSLRSASTISSMHARLYIPFTLQIHVQKVVPLLPHHTSWALKQLDVSHQSSYSICVYFCEVASLTLPSTIASNILPELPLECVARILLVPHLLPLKHLLRYSGSSDNQQCCLEGVQIHNSAEDTRPKTGCGEPL